MHYNNAIISFIFLFNTFILFRVSHSQYDNWNKIDIWNFTEWWLYERSEPLTKRSPMVFESPTKFTYTNIPEFATIIDKNSENSITTSVDKLNETIIELFSHPRNWNDNQIYLKKLRDLIKNRFNSYGLITAFQTFKIEDTKRFESNGSIRPLYSNIIGILPGLKRGTDADEIIVVGAHYDTVRNTPGVDDNGSGSAAVIEIARVLAEHHCKFDKTIIFVLFDLEEEFLKGSKYFVQHYLIPIEIIKNKSKFTGAFIMDMILTHNKTIGSQTTKDYEKILPEFAEEVRDEECKGNFGAVWGRRYVDDHLYFALKKNWNDTLYPIRLMDPPLPPLGVQLTLNWVFNSQYGTFARSDHASFWYPIGVNMTFGTILISDLGPWRHDMMNSYHRPSDDTRWLNTEDLLFMKNTVDSLLATLIDLGDGRCYARN